MPDILSAFHSLTGSSQPTTANELAEHFAIGLGWNPSYFSSSPNDNLSNGHLIVEYGLENTAVLSFLKCDYLNMNHSNKMKLLSVSYNNLVDWHIIIDRDNCNLVYNRTTNSTQLVDSKRLLRDSLENQLRSEAFEKLLGKRPSPNIQALDDALIETISIWKRKISNELDNDISNKNLSNFFNSLIFIRALEDTERRYGRYTYEFKLLEEILFSNELEQNTYENIVELATAKMGKPNYLRSIIDIESLSVFNGLSKGTLAQLFSDFYGESQLSKYRYDFSIMSKHALSRIYEKYISILYIEESPQLSFLASMPQEISVNKSFGAYYTPEFIAKFFARYIKKEFSIQSLKSLKVMEPAVGSGIFLRTLLESIYENNLQNQSSIDFDRSHFENVYGLDIDENAVQATKLSLALLHLVIFNSFPETLNIQSANSLSWFSDFQRSERKQNFDIFLSNPPFIKYDEQNPVLRSELKSFLGDLSTGKPDLYFAFIKIAIENLNPDGLALFVLPNNFLLSQSAKKLRAFLSENTVIRFWADLSEITVFEAGVYVTLLIFQKKSNSKNQNKKVTILKCRSAVGKALQLALNKNFTVTNSFDIYELPQSAFAGSEWTVLNSKDYLIKKQMDLFPRIDRFLDVRQGFATGNDSVFIRSKLSIPESELSIYKDFIPDKQIFAYDIPEINNQVVFYPFIDGKKVTQEQLRLDYPKTWDYLVTNRKVLAARRTATNDWWLPTNPRKPEHINQPKIITPHLTISPRFSIDVVGDKHVSHSPYLFTKKEVDLELLYYFMAILNSTPCFWYVSTHSHKMSRSYAMIEVKTLKNTPVPNPYEINKHDLIQLIKLSKSKMTKDGKTNFEIDKNIDEIVCRLYKFSEDETNFILGIK